MIWNCNGKVRRITFVYNRGMNGRYYCWIDGAMYAWEASFRNAGPWDWLKDGYTKKLAEWVG